MADLALRIAIQCQDMASSVTKEFGTTLQGIASIVDEVDIGLTGLAASVDDAVVSVSVLDDTVVSSNGYLASLGDQVFTTGAGFDGMAASADAASASLDGVVGGVDLGAMSFQGFNEYCIEANLALGIWHEETVSAAASTDALTASTDALAASTAGEAAAMGSANDANKAASASLGGVQLALIGIGVGVGIAGAATAKMAGDFQQSMIKSQAEAGLTQQQMTDMGNAIIDMGPKVGQVPVDLANGLFFVESAGFAGKNALSTLSLSAQMASNDMADTTTVAKGLTTAVKAFGYDTGQSAYVANQMTETVSLGKMTMADYAQSIGKVALTAHGFGVSMGETNAALDTLTNNGFPSAAQASTALQNVLQQFDGNTAKVAKNIKALGIQGFDETKFKAMDLGQQVQYLSNIMKGHEDQLQKVLGGSKSAAQGFKALAGDTSGYQNALEKLNTAQANGGAEAQAFAATQQGLNFKVNQAKAALDVLGITIGNAFIPILSQVASAILPVISGFSNFITWLNKTNLLIPVISGILVGLAVLIAAMVLPALWSMAVAAWASLGPWGYIALAIAGVVAAFIYFYTSCKPFKDFIDNTIVSVKNFAAVLWGNLQTALGFIGNFLRSTFMPVWQQLQDTWNNQIMPSVNQLIATFNQIKPELTILAQFIGGVLVVAFGLLVGSIAGFVGGIAGMAQGLIKVFGGVVQMISGVVQTISGIVSFIVDLFTGQWGKLGGDIQVILGGIGNIFKGFGNVLSGIVEGIVKGVAGEFSGMATGVLGYFNQIAVQVTQNHAQMRKNTESEIDKLKNSTGDKFGSIQKDAQNIVGNTGKWIEDRWNDASSAVTGTVGKMGKGIQDATGSAGKWIQDKWHEASTKVADGFNYMYKHSYVFQAIVDNVRNAFNAVKNAVISVWTATSTWLVGAWNATAKFATDLWNTIAKSVSDNWNKAVKWVQDTWKNISDTFSSAWNTYIAPPLTACWNTVSKFFSGVWTNYIAGPIGDLWNSLSSTVSGWATSAWQWGVNLITGLANGISSAAKGALHDALTGAANLIKSILAWHSPTKEGPGSDSDTWAPNLVKMMSTGLEAGIPQIQQAAIKLATPIALNLGNKNFVPVKSFYGTPMQGNSTTTNNSSGGTVIHNFNISTQGGWSRSQVDDMYKQIKQRLDRDYRTSGNHITNTSGGRV